MQTAYHLHIEVQQRLDVSEMYMVIHNLIYTSSQHANLVSENCLNVI